MPYFIIDCSKQIVEKKLPENIMQKVYDAAEWTKLFQPEKIKVRINPFQYYNTRNTNNNFIHVFANIMEGRNSVQKANLSKQIIAELKAMFPKVPSISINIGDFDKATYCNREMY
ncbi:5-carboxymethyl-2-hydroxymuconate Delta-isomerase [Arenibacter palladensis]|uniref:5-carboxymethyl-2-hydroxymuconate Delta-isomerase n=1 Tax=Arenibacter palladensis TaxID=237373 RepID=UPI0026E36562|nr:5-carboxymethyl-2-hydroxymuconate isomerase [Arenibacter palladensis]MDO6603465.1 5-carboxymethyl-2-hydroxymuconate isomerase [Arenibacter palladensis]